MKFVFTASFCWLCSQFGHMLDIIFSPVLGIYAAPDPPIQHPAKDLEDGRDKMGKNQFSIEIFVCKFLNFLKSFKCYLVFDQSSKDLPLDFLISFRIIKGFQNSIILALIFIKISFFK